MNTLAQLCRERTNLHQADIAQLEQISHSLQLLANLTAADIFIDCLNRSKAEALVVAQAQPQYGRRSLYEGSVVGMPVYKKNEPAVFQAFDSGNPVRDLKAITQEKVIVKQDVAPIYSGDDRLIGVLIRERDISDSLLQEKKYLELAKQQEERNNMNFSSELSTSRAAMRETHHRVKNSLQMVASIMRLQARQCGEPDIQRIFEENTNRVLSIASTHDIISMNGSIDEVPLRTLLVRIARNLELLAAAKHPISIEVEGNDIYVDADTAASVALVVNELVSNSLEHGYHEGESGKILISIHEGTLHSTIWVEDDGHGFAPEALDQKRLGLQLVSLTVHDKLNGDLFVSSSEKGTRISFDFKNTL